ncbi:MAG: ABC transporter ATP-binding protein [Azospirillaceae bacterium]
MGAGDALLAIENLSVSLPGDQGPRRVLRGLDLEVERGQTYGIVGESGSGKSITALAVMGLLPDRARVEGRVLFDGHDLAQADERAMCRIRGNRIGMVFQEPMTALNPAHAIGRQIAESVILHEGASRKTARARALDLLDLAGIPDPASRIDDYPHQLSGGQRQRVVIAIALACRPDLLIADEPTTALDVTVQAQILELLTDLTERLGMSLILISHDLGVVASLCQRTAVLYAGRLVEEGPTAALLARHAHPYTAGLMAARPRLTARAGERLTAIRGTLPDPESVPAGCIFAARCPYVIDDCRAAEPALHEAGDGGHVARCIRLEAVA